jgi:IMP dehydrogenase
MSKDFYLGLGKTEQWPALTRTDSMALSFDDVLIMPRNSTVASRKDVDTTAKLGPYTLQLPIISAPMDTITGEEMARKLHELGAIAALPRNPTEDSLAICERLVEDNIPCIYSVGLKGGFEHAKALKDRGAEVILLDVANGGSDVVRNEAIRMKKELKVTIIAGNISTYEQAERYKKDGIDIARVGIGGGGLCTTRLKTGVGTSQLSAIFEAVETGIPTIADGGIHYPGDVAKAMAAGATVVMIGSMFGGTQETPGIVIDGKKVVRGQASASYMDDNKVERSKHRTAEGITTQVNAIGSVSEIIEDISGGLRSAMSYVGADTLRSFYERTQFATISAATQKENQPHIIFDRQ